MADKNKHSHEEQLETTLAHEVTEPPMYKVILHNDNYTTMEFVILILESVFYKTSAQATEIMLNVHKHGQGICGVFPYEIAETKVAIVKKLAEEQQYPLLCTMEEE